MFPSPFARALPRSLHAIAAWLRHLWVHLAQPYTWSRVPRPTSGCMAFGGLQGGDPTACLGRLCQRLVFPSMCPSGVTDMLLESLTQGIHSRLSHFPSQCSALLVHPASSCCPRTVIAHCCGPTLELGLREKFPKGCHPLITGPKQKLVLPCLGQLFTVPERTLVPLPGPAHATVLCDQLWWVLSSPCDGTS